MQGLNLAEAFWQSLEPVFRYLRHYKKCGEQAVR